MFHKGTVDWITKLENILSRETFNPECIIFPTLLLF